MEFITTNWQLFLIAFFSGAFLLVSYLRKSSGVGLTPPQVVAKINQEKAVVVDVRDAERFEIGHVVGAKNITMDEIKAGEFKGLPKNKALPLVLVCATGYTSGKAISAFKGAGYENVFNLDGGIGAWIKDELPLENSSGKAKVKTNDKEKPKEKSKAKPKAKNKAADKAADKAVDKAEEKEEAK